VRKRYEGTIKVLSLLVLLLLILITTRVDSVFAQDDPPLSEVDLGVVIPPTPVEPVGNCWTNDLQHKWTVFAGLTDYQYQVWDGTTNEWDKAVSSSSVCGSTYCMDIPTELDLIDGAYLWQVWAYASRIWSDWSSLKWLLDQSRLYLSVHHGCCRLAADLWGLDMGYP